MSKKLMSLFNKASNQIDLVQSATGRVGTGPLALQKKSFEMKKSGIANLPITINGKVEASAQIYEVGQAVEVFRFENPTPSPPPPSFTPLPGIESQPEQAEPPPNTAFSEMVVFIGAGASANVTSGPAAPLSLSASAAASGSLRYRLLLPAKATILKAWGILNENRVITLPPAILVFCHPSHDSPKCYNLIDERRS